MMNLLSANKSQLSQTDPRDAFRHHRAMHNLSVINWQWSATHSRSNKVDSTCDDRRALVKFFPSPEFRTREVSLFWRYEISLKFKVGQIKKAFVVG